MKGIDEFVKLFGDVTMLQIVEISLAFVFMCFVYRQIKKYFRQKIDEENRRIESEKARDARIEGQISELKGMYTDITDRLTQMEELTNRRERNKIRDRLLHNYRYYTNPESNPTRSWTRMESEAFWELFSEYEEAGGDGYMHTVVMPAMQVLRIVEPGIR